MTEQSKESSSLGVLDNNILVFVAKARSKWIIDIGLTVGAQVPAYCTGMGRVLLANMGDEFQNNYLDTKRLEMLNEKTVTK